MLPFPEGTGSLYKDVLIIMKDDEITNVVKNDKIILEYGKRLQSYSHKKHRHLYVAQKLRELARLVIVLKMSVDDLLEVRNWDKLISDIKCLAGFDSENHKYKVTSIPLKIGHSLAK